MTLLWGSRRSQAVLLKGLPRRRAPKPATPRADAGTRISSDTRLFVWQRDAGRCQGCGSRKDLQFDHLIPRSSGGSSSAENVQILCRSCNLRKGATVVDDKGIEVVC
jgi:hypothetical protein